MNSDGVFQFLELKNTIIIIFYLLSIIYYLKNEMVFREKGPADRGRFCVCGQTQNRPLSDKLQIAPRLPPGGSRGPPLCALMENLANLARFVLQFHKRCVIVTVDMFSNPARRSRP